MIDRDNIKVLAVIVERELDRIVGSLQNLLEMKDSDTFGVVVQHLIPVLPAVECADDELQKVLGRLDLTVTGIPLLDDPEED